MIKYVDSINDIDSFEGQWQTNCPQCLHKIGKIDTGHKLGINFDKGVFNCYRCGFKGSVDFLFKNKKDYQFSILENFVKSSNIKKELIFDKNLNIIVLDFISIEINKYMINSMRYIKSRGLDYSDIERYNIRLGTGIYKDRIIFPVFDNYSNCIFFTARTITNSIIRYVNPIDINKNQVVWNLNNYKSGGIAICEGVLDGISVDKSNLITPVSLFGKSISYYQAKLIANCNPSFILLCFDKDVNVKVFNKNISILRKYYSGKIYISDFSDLQDCKDFNDILIVYGKEKVTDIISRDIANKNEIYMRGLK